jgi:hypothetical protein
MAQWLVNEGDRQFAARDFEELKRFASQGRVGPGAMIQPPGSGEWIYASEVPGVRELLRASPSSSEDYPSEMPQAAQPRRGLLVAGLGFLALVSIGLILYFASGLPEGEDLKLLGGSSGLSLNEMIVTEANAPLRASPNKQTKATLSLMKDSRVKLLAKRGSWYEVEASGGKRGWVEVDDVVPAYYFAGAKDRENYDPIYNPDRYLFVKNSSWMALPDKSRENVTLFQFQLQNKSKFDMKDIILMATIKDKNGNVLERKEIPIEGVVRAFDGAPVGTVRPPEKQPEVPSRTMTYALLEEIARNDPDLWLRWSDGVEVAMGSPNYVEANIELIQATAVPREK